MSVFERRLLNSTWQITIINYRFSKTLELEWSMYGSAISIKLQVAWFISQWKCDHDKWHVVMHTNENGGGTWHMNKTCRLIDFLISIVLNTKISHAKWWWHNTHTQDSTHELTHYTPYFEHQHLFFSLWVCTSIHQVFVNEN